MRILLNTFTVVITVFLVMVFTPVSINAQSTFGPSTDTISLSQTPRFPEPNQVVNVSVVSRVINIDNKQTAWEVNGETVASGAGVKEIDVTVGGRNETTRVIFRVIIEGEVIERVAQITPADINLVWESEDSYTPPFYKGKALHPGWGPVRITALSHIEREDGTLYSPNELLYTWEYNGLVHGDDSGRGQDSFVVNALPRRGNTVSVEIENTNREVIAQRSVTLPNTEPEVVMYSYNTLFGPQTNRVLEDTFELVTDDEVELIAYPYFFLVDNETAPQLEYDWKMNGETLSPPEEKNIVRLRRQSGVRGEARIDVNVGDTSRMFSDQSAWVNLEF